MANTSNYAKINDYELIYMIHQEDENAMKYLLQKYDAYLWSLAGRNWQDTFFGLDKEDCHLEAQIKLIDAVFLYRETAGASFMTYATMIINRRLSTLRRNAQREREQLAQGVLSLDWFVGEGESSYLVDMVENNQSTFDPAYHMEYSRLVRLIDDYVNGLSKEDRKIWSMMTRDISYQKASEQLQITRKAYDNRVYRIKKKFMKCLKDKMNEF